MNRADRWRIALHESGHLVCGRTLSKWSLTVRAALLPDGSAAAGMADAHPALSPFRDAAMRAAGRRAEGLARLFGPPEKRERTDAPSPSADAPERLPKKQARQIVENFRRSKHFEPDGYMVAHFCVGSGEAGPREWGKVYRRVHAQSRLSVWIHRREIVAVAERLFLDGAVVLEGDPEQDEVFNNSPRRTVEA